MYLENYFSFTNAGNIFAILIFAWIVITFLTGLCFLFWLFFLAKIYRVMCIFLYTGLPHCRHILYQLSHKGSPRILEWVSYPFSRFSWPRDLTWGILHCRQILYQLSHKGSPRILEWVAYPFSLDLPDPGIEPGSPALQEDSLPTELPGKPIFIAETH